jgi:hypothetical protein
VPGFIDGPAVWRGEELLARRDWQWTLSDSEITELARATDAAADVDLDQITRASFALPTLARRLAEI